MTQLFANNAFSTLAAAITSAATSLSVQPGQGARFPAPTNGDFFALTLFQLIGGVEANHEVVYVTARSVDTLTITRAQEGTTARAWGVGDQASHRGTAGTLGGMAQLGAPAQFTQPVYVPTPTAGANTTQAASTAFVTAAVQQAKADLIANSPGALDTLNELASALGNDANFSATTAAALGNRLRVDVNTQGLNAAQKANAVTNLGLATVAVSGAKADVGLGNVDNTSDANKPVSTAQAAALAPKASPAFTGNVLIGTVTDNGVDKLQVAGTASVSGLTIGLASVGSNAIQNVNVFSNTDASGNQVRLNIDPINGNTAAQGVYFGAARNGATYTSSLVMGTANAEAARIDSSGNMMVGTTAVNSSARLSVTGGDMIVSRTGVNTGLGIESVGGSGKKYYMISDTSGTLQFYDGTAAATRAFISSAGNFGVGTPPLYKLHVDSGAIAVNAGGNVAGAGGSVYMNAVGNTTAPMVGIKGMLDWCGGYEEQGSMAFLTRATTNAVGSALTEKMRLSNTGNLLVGSTGDDNTNKLQVNGSVRATKQGDAANLAYKVDGGGWVQPNLVGHFYVSQDGVSLRVPSAGYAQTSGITVLADGTTAFNGSSAERARISSAGNLLVGTTSDNGTDRLQVNGSSAFTGQLTINTTTGLLDVRGKSSANIVPDIQISRTSTIATVGQGANIQFNDTGTINNSRIIQAGAGSMQFFGYGGGGWAEHMRIDASGNLLVGTTSGSCHTIQKPGAGGGTLVLSIGGLDIAGFYGVDQSAYTSANAALAALKLGSSLSNRSLSTTGTVNASGADYAEYMTKADACGMLAKGQIVGIDATGKLTDQWASAVSFLIKSTDPSYVGGDVWGSEEALGIQRPVEPQFQAPAYTGSADPGTAPVDPTAPSADTSTATVSTTTAPQRATLHVDDLQAAYQTALSDFLAAQATYAADQAAHAAAVATAQTQFDSITMPAYKAALATFNAALEAARQKVDRIAYCGQVPVNVTGATPGQYVVPVQDGAGIKGVLVNKADMTLAQYMSAVGVVQNTLPDGRANVRVKPV